MRCKRSEDSLKCGKDRLAGRDKERKLPEKFDAYSEIMNALLTEAITCSPESWDKGTLSIQCDGRQINYQLKNDESEDKAQLSDDLRRLCENFYVAMRQGGDAWNEAKTHFARKEDSWSFKSEFQYAESATVQPAASSSTVKKPWWRFW
jgi:hypothetical protein